MNKIIKNMRNTGNQIKASISQFGKITSIGIGGKKMNVQNIFDGEIRDLKTIAPYGISSSAIDGIGAQAIVNDFDNNVVVGVYDGNKPDVNPGEVIIYNSGKSRIKLGKNNNISITNGSTTVLLSGDDVTINGSNVNITGDMVSLSGGSANMSSDGNNMNTSANVINIVGNSSATISCGSGSINMSSNGDITINGNTITVNASVFTVNQDQ